MRPSAGGQPRQQITPKFAQKLGYHLRGHRENREMKLCRYECMENGLHLELQNIGNGVFFLHGGKGSMDIPPPGCVMQRTASTTARLPGMSEEERSSSARGVPGGKGRCSSCTGAFSLLPSQRFVASAPTLSKLIFHRCCANE